MMNKMSRMLVTTAMLMFPACAKQAGSSQVAGTGVNNGTGPVGDYLICQNPQDDVKLTIRGTAIPTFIQGLLEVDGRIVDMKCVPQKGQEQAPGADHQASLWSCTEIRNGEGLYSVEVVRQGFSALRLATVHQDMAYPEKPRVVSSLGCKDGENTNDRG